MLENRTSWDTSATAIRADIRAAAGTMAESVAKAFRDETTAHLPESMFAINKIISRFGKEELIPFLIELCHDDESFTQLGAAYYLLFLGESDLSIVDLFAKVMTNPRNKFFRLGLIILAGLPSVPDILVRTTKVLLDSEISFYSVYAAAVVREAEPTKSLHVLRRALHSDDLSFAAIAAFALGRMGVMTEEAVRVLVRGLEKATPEMRVTIVCYLAQLGTIAADAWPALMDMVEDRREDKDLRQFAAMALGRIAQKSATKAKLGSRLTKSLRSSDWVTACLAALSLKELGGESRHVIKTLVEMLPDPNVDTRTAAAMTLAEFGTDAATAIPALINRLKVEQEKEPIIALILVFSRIGVRSIPFLVDVVKKGSILTMSLASAALGAIGHEAAEEVVRALLTQEEPWVRSMAATALMAMGPRAANAVPEMIRLLDAGHEGLHAEVLQVLSSIGPMAVAASDCVVRKLIGSNQYHSEWAATTLVNIGPESIPALEKALAGTHGEAFNRITDVLKRLGVMSGSRSGSDFSWVGDNALLELYVWVGEYLEANGPTSYRDLSRQIKRAKAQGRISEKIKHSDRYIPKKIMEFEAKLSHREGREIRLKERDSTRQTGLTEDGKSLLVRVRSYLERGKSSDEPK